MTFNQYDDALIPLKPTTSTASPTPLFNGNKSGQQRTMEEVPQHKKPTTPSLFPGSRPSLGTLQNWGVQAVRQARR